METARGTDDKMTGGKASFGMIREGSANKELISTKAITHPSSLITR